MNLFLQNYLLDTRIIRPVILSQSDSLIVIFSNTSPLCVTTVKFNGMTYDNTVTVDILTMHNTSPQLFLCIVRFYARSDVSHSVTICHLCQKCHTSNMVLIFMGEKLLP